MVLGLDFEFVNKEKIIQLQFLHLFKYVVTVHLEFSVKTLNNGKNYFMFFCTYQLTTLKELIFKRKI